MMVRSFLGGLIGGLAVCIATTASAQVMLSRKYVEGEVRVQSVDTATKQTLVINSISWRPKSPWRSKADRRR